MSDPTHFCVECAPHWGVAAFRCNPSMPGLPEYDFERCDSCAGFADDNEAIEFLAYMLNEGILQIVPGPNYKDRPKIKVLTE